MAHVVNPQGKSYVVKNLGWLLKHLPVSVVDHLEVSSYTSLYDQKQFLLDVYFEDGYKFQAVFNSYLNLKDWLSRRRTLTGAKLIWFGDVAPADWSKRFTQDVAAYELANLRW